MYLMYYDYINSEGILQMKLDNNEFLCRIEYLAGFTKKGKSETSNISTESLIMECSNNKLTLKTTDLLNMCVVSMPFIHDDFNVSVNIGQLKKTLTQHKNKEIDISLIKNHLVIKHKKSSSKLKVSDSIDFPLIPEKKEDLGQVDFSEFKSIIRSCLFAALDPSKGSSGVLESINFEKEYICATDGYKLCLIENTPLFSSPFKIHASFLKSFIKSPFDQKCRLHDCDSFILFDFDDTEVYLRKTFINYPDIKRLIRKEHSYFIEVDKNKIKTALNLASSFSDEQHANVIFNFQNGELEIKSTNDHGEFQEFIEIESDVQLKMIFQTRFIKDVISEIKASKLTLKIKDSLSPVFVESESDFKQVVMIMPVRQ